MPHYKNLSVKIRRRRGRNKRKRIERGERRKRNEGL